MFEQYTAATRVILRLEKVTMSKDAWLKEVRDISHIFWGQYPIPKPDMFPMPVEAVRPP